MNNDIEQQGNDFEVKYDDDMTLIEKLKELDAAGDKATQGEWVKDYDATIGHIKSVGFFDNATPTILRYDIFSKYYPRFFKSITPKDEQNNALFVELAANNRTTIKAAIVALKKQARDIVVLREALLLSEQIEKANWSMAGQKEKRKAIKGFQRKRLKALEQTGE